MRLGGSVMKPYNSPKEWLAQVKELGYSAVVFPVDSNASAATIRDYAQCCRDNDLLIGEVGAWRNVMAIDPKEREANLDWNIRQLELAETVGANCCVNISGSTGDNLNKLPFSKSIISLLLSFDILAKLFRGTKKLLSTHLSITIKHIRNSFECTCSLN